MNPSVVLVVPTPKRARFEGNAFPLDAGEIVVRFAPAYADAATIIERGLRDRKNIRVRMAPQKSGNLTLSAGAAPDFPIPAVPNKPEGYALRVTESGAALAGRDARGRLWAAQTLLQLLSGSRLLAAEIEDWPTLSIRGVHLFHGPEARPFHEKLIERVFAPFKLNTLVVQGDTIGWTALKKSPEHVGSVADVREEARFARAHGIDAFPLIPSHGHMWWLLGKERARYREDPDSSWAINATDPAALALLEKIHDEASAIFGSKNHHFGLDEVIDPVTPRGRVPYRSKVAFAPLFARNAAHWHDWSKRRGKRMWLWADMLMHPSEVTPAFGTAPTPADARYLRANLPKDAVVVDWQYSERPSYPSLKLLRSSGFENRVIATWLDPGGTLAFSQAAATGGALGGLQTTWCGYESAESVLDGPERRQFAAMALAAEAFWNGGVAPPWKPAEIFDRAWAGRGLNDPR